MKQIKNINILRKIQKSILLLMEFLFFNGIVFSQDFHFSQMSSIPLFVNPAYTGMFASNQRVISNYKDQWKSVASPFKTIHLSFDTRMLEKKIKSGVLGFGAMLLDDKAGDIGLNTTQSNLLLAYHIALNKYMMLSAGFNGGWVQRSISNDMKLYTWDSQYDGNGFNQDINTGEIPLAYNYSYINYSSGILLHYFSPESDMISNDGIKANMGFSMYRIKRPKVSFYELLDARLDHRFVLHGEALIGLAHTNMAIVPSFYITKQNVSQEIIGGLMLRRMITKESKYTNTVKGSALSIGVHYRVGDAVIASTVFEIGSFSFGFSYDITVSKMLYANNGQGGAEIFLSFRTPNPFGPIRTKQRKIYDLRLIRREE